MVGLGNPGEEYRDSRHNLGFEVLDRLAATLGVRFARQAREPGLGPVKARVASGRLREEDEHPFLLVKPQTFMNLSGSAVAAYARHYRIPSASIFVILDDLNLPLGRIRIRPGGSPGGHNGLKSIVSRLGTEGFPRLRMGIAAPDMGGSDMADPDFVLGRFTDEERDRLDPVLAEAVAAARAWIGGAGLDVLMNRFNTPRHAADDPLGSD